MQQKTSNFKNSSSKSGIKNFIKYVTFHPISLDKKHKSIIPAEILNSENSLIDEVQYLCGQTTNIKLIPHLIEELVKIKLFRNLNKFLTFYHLFYLTKLNRPFIVGKVYSQNNLLFIKDLMF